MVQKTYSNHNMKIRWTRGSDEIKYTRPDLYFCLGTRGSGKSTFLENTAEGFLEAGNGVLDLFGCYDDRTEILTVDGWKFFKDVTIKDLVATRDKHNFLVFIKPTKIHSYPFKGKLMAFENEHFDLLVTPNHRMFVYSLKKGSEFITAENLFLTILKDDYDIYSGYQIMVQEIGPGVVPITKNALSQIDYEGFVYCVSVPPNETVFVRRNGKTAWSGNSKDGESLAWLRSHWAENKKILLLKGENVDVKCSWPVKNAEQLELSDFENYDLIISSSPLYANMDQEFSEASIIENKLYQRMEYDKIVFMCCREASNFFYSRLKVSDNQLFAKSEMVYLLRESRHMGVSLGLDSLRSYAIDIDIRCLADYTILKAQGVQGLSRELKWLYNYIDAKLLRTLSPDKFFVVTRTGSIGAGVFKEITWHKQERENILKVLGITREVGEMTREAQNKGTFKTVSDKEHKEIIERYGEGDISMVNLAAIMQRSSRTIQMHVEAHNQAVEKAGFCGVCKRAKSKYECQSVGHGLSS